MRGTDLAFAAFVTGALLAAAVVGRASVVRAASIRPDRATPIRQLGPAGTLVLRADFTGRGPATATVHADARGVGTLTVAAAGRVLLQVAGVGGVGLVAFAHHLPILVTETDMCGSGGCFYVGYTYVPAVRRLEPIDGAVGLTGVRLALRGRRWVRAGPPSTAFWGFVTLDASGLVFTWRTYDAQQHRGHQRYVYVPSPDGAGVWRALGSPWFTPDAPLAGRYVGAGTVVGAATQFLVGVCLGLPVEAASAAGPGLGRRLYAAARREIVPCVYPAMTGIRETRAGPGRWTVTLRLSTQGEGVPLDAYALRLQVTTRREHAVTGIAASRIALRVRTRAQALAALASSPVVRAWVGSHPGVVAQFPTPQGSQAWEEWSILPGNKLAAATVDARTGTVTAPRA